MPNRRGFRWVTRRVIRRVIASGQQECIDLLAPYSSVVDNLKGHTVTRILMRFGSVADTVDQITECDYGIALVNADAAAAGAFPDADVEGDNVRWLLRDYQQNVVSSLTQRHQRVERTYDLRAQALLRSDQEELHLIVDQESGGGAIFSMQTRVLLRLP